MPASVGIATILIDPHQVYPFDFRVEKSAAMNSLAVLAGPESPIRCCVRRPTAAKPDRAIRLPARHEASRQYGIM
jgi:hypothetical protein